MKLRTKKRLLNLMTVGLLIATGGVVYLGSQTDSLHQFDYQSHLESQAANTLVPEDAPPLLVSLTPNDFEPLWGIPLRQPLYDPPPPPPPKPPEKPPLPPLTAKLLATMIEPNSQVAMLQLQSGEVVFRKEGEELGGNDQNATIMHIAAGTIKIQRGDEEALLMIEAAGGVR